MLTFTAVVKMSDYAYLTVVDYYLKKLKQFLKFKDRIQNHRKIFKGKVDKER